jgi:tetratricopeptide (TPR) repeat protein
MTNTSRKITSLAALACLLTALCPLSAPRAQEAAAQEEPDKLRALIAEATRLAVEGQYDEAIDRYFEAKTIRDDPRLDFNIARCYHKKGDCPSAVQFYKAVRARSDADPQDTADADRYLKALGQCPVQGPEEVVVAPPAQPPASNDSGFRWVGWGLTTAGALTLAAAIWLDLDGESLIKDYEAAGARGDEAAYNDLRTQIEAQQVGVGYLYGGGGALLLGGLLILLLDGYGEGGAPAQGAAWRVSPALTPGGAGAALEARF